MGSVVAGLAVGIVGALLLLALWRGGGDDVAEPEVAVAHVHGLGVDGDGGLLAATHHGLFRVPPDGRAEPVGVPRDTMGLTIGADGRLLASGHPAFQGDPLYDAELTPLLGLVASDDGGESWETLSLAGEADFHALEVVGSTVFGADATGARFMASEDGVDWQVRSAVALSDFVVDPTAPDEVLGVGGEGLLRSGDGGRTWQAVDGPSLVMLAWDDGPIGVDELGAVHVLGRGWEEVGRLPGAPQALVARRGELYAAAEDGDRTGIFVSRDGGRSWELRYRDPASAAG